MGRVWPGRAVENVNLTVQISHLRKAMGKRPDGTEWIVAVPGFGYQLKAWAEHPEPPADPPVVAVMPFDNLTGDTDRLYLVDGFVDELIHALTRFRSFTVLSRSATRALRASDMGPNEPGQRARSPLQARYVVEGSFRSLRPGLRAVITLASADGAVLWSERFQGSMDDILAFQEQVVQKVALTIAPQIQAAELRRSRRERPTSLAAYDLYLQAVHKIYQFDAKANAEALELLDRAIEAEPRHARHLALACWGRELRITFGWPFLGPDDHERCLDFAERTIALAPDDATALARCGLALQLVGLDYARGLEVADRAVEINPNDLVALVNAGVAHFLAGDLNVTVRIMRYLISRQPHLAYEPLGVLACALAALGDHEEALACAQRGLAINTHYAPNHWIAVASAAHLGRLDEARAALARLLRLAPELTVAKLLRVRPQDQS